MGWAISDLVIAAAVRQHFAGGALEKAFLLPTDAAAGRQFLGHHVRDNGWRAVEKSSTENIKAGRSAREEVIG